MIASCPECPCFHTLQRQNAENLKQIFPEKEYQGLSPNLHVHVSVSELYMPMMGLPVLLEEICRSWEYINRSKTHECGNWGWGRAIPRKGLYKRNCRCSAVYSPESLTPETLLILYQFLSMLPAHWYTGILLPVYNPHKEDSVVLLAQSSFHSSQGPGNIWKDQTHSAFQFPYLFIPSSSPDVSWTEFRNSELQKEVGQSSISFRTVPNPNFSLLKLT